MVDKAKTIFFTYHGNHSAMANDGVYDEYKSYGISKEQETIWLNSLSDKVSKLSNSQNFRVDFVLACSYVRKLKQRDRLDELFAYLLSEKTDICEDSGKLQMADAFVDAVTNIDINMLNNKYASRLNIFLLAIKKNSIIPEISIRVDKLIQRITVV